MTKGTKPELPDLQLLCRRLTRLMRDPQLARNIDESTSSLSLIMRHLEAISKDLRVFSDKIARHPELLGVRGTFEGSSGIK